MNNHIFSSAADVFTWLSQFENLEQGQISKTFNLDQMEILVRVAGHPETCAPVIHIAGSKGKGSVTGMITAILEAEGLKTARYTSPHVTEERERITQGNNFFDESIYCGSGSELVSIVEAYREAKQRADAPAGDNQEPTFFELLTLYFFLCARTARCDVMVVETGMGGRLDATNMVDPLVSVITVIELEHTDVLGSTIEAIAREKAGIIKNRRPLILGEQSPEALGVFQKAVVAKQAPLYYFPDVADIQNLRLSREGTTFTLHSKPPLSLPSPLELAIHIPGEIQAKNASMAVIAAKIAFPGLHEQSIHTGLKDFTLPARFERIGEDPIIVIDGAHTPRSVAASIETFTGLYGKGGILIFGCVAGKAAETMAQILIPVFAHIIITTPGTYKVSFPEKVYETFQTIAAHQAGKAKGGPSLCFIKETDKAIEEAIALGRKQGLPILGTGSFYLAAEIRAYHGSIV
ncbi:MAG: tetrahydrofolate synthase [Treponema sp.]|jgi:dihydrofolate synthase/folylpolyglutamate synthase|nr:tetrahydrofolate synthase [Treponema sp.]